MQVVVITHNTMDAPLIYTHTFVFYVFISTQTMTGFIYSYSFHGLKGVYAIQVKKNAAILSSF